MPRDAFVLKIQRESRHLICARKVSGLSRNGPQGLVTRAQFLLCRAHALFDFVRVVRYFPYHVVSRLIRFSFSKNCGVNSVGR